LGVGICRNRRSLHYSTKVIQSRRDGVKVAQDVRVCVRTHQSRRDWLRDTFSRPYTGLDFARIPYPALRAGLLSAVPSGLNPGLVGSHADAKARRILSHLRHDSSRALIQNGSFPQPVCLPVRYRRVEGIFAHYETLRNWRGICFRVPAKSGVAAFCSDK
jgi:hypothetical protein